MAQNQVKIQLGFSADISEAKSQIEQLQKTLSNLSVNTLSTKTLTDDVYKSIDAVNDLNTMLQSSKNAAGTLDMGKFALSLKQSGKTIQQYGEELASLGPEGVLAFTQISQAVQQANTPLLKAKGLLADFASQMARTASIQLSYGILNSITGAFSEAFRYAQKLDKSLNDIRIVTMKSSDDMKDFALQANKAAKSLSATTEEYTKGSLIYYQQGLNDEEVIERTNTTIKLANTSGESAEAISSYMTAIWNNFSNGADDLELYADKLSYLGAVSAASNADIAEGLQAFAATANTVGLSYDYAAAALTTLVDKTQQSASTIGNSLKTIFARLENVKLGDTLEDGVDLTKYTKALKTVGVEVLDANGDLKKMDDILDDLAKRWDTLTNAQKNALAQTVGGVRQYNNLISLMDNYDTFQDFVGGAKGSKGYLDEQAEIYAESWEASMDRVQAAWEGLYNTLVKSDFFIGLNNGISTLISSIDNVIKSSGGIPTLLITIGTLATSLFKDKLVAGINNVQATLMQFTTNGKASIETIKNELRSISIDLASNPDSKEPVPTLFTTLTQSQSILDSYKENLQSLDPIQRRIVQGHIETFNTMSNEILSLAQQQEAQEELIKNADKYKLTEEQITSATNEKNRLTKEISDKLKITEAYASKIADHMDHMSVTEPSIVDSWLNIANYAGSFMTAVTQISSIIKTWGNEDLSGWEKITSTLTSIIFLMPMAIKLYKGLTDVQLLNSIGVVKNTISNAAQAISITKVVSSTKTQTTELGSNTVATDTNTVAKTANAAANTAVAETGAAAGAGAGAAAAGTSAFAGALGTLVGAIGSFIGAAAPYLILLGLIVGRYKYINETSPEAKLKDLTEASKSARTNTEELANAYKDVKTSLDDLDKNQDTLKNLKQNTVEWTQAVIDNNQKILELLKNYNLLNENNYSIDEKTGIWSLTADGKKAISDAASKRYRSGLEAQMLTQAQTENARQDKIRTDLSKDTSVIKYYGEDDDITTVTSGQILAKVQKAIDTGNFTFTGNNLTDAFDVIDWGSLDESVVKEILANERTAQALVENTTAINESKMLQQTYLDTLLQNKYGDKYDLSGLTEEQKQAYYNKVNTKAEQVLSGGLDNDEIARYKEAMGIDAFDTDVDKNSWFAGAGDNKYVFKDRQGNIITSVTGQEIANLLAALDTEISSNALSSWSKISSYSEDETTTGDTANDITKWKLNQEEINSTADALRELRGEENLTASMAEAIVVANEKLNAGYADLLKNYKDYIDVLKTGNATSVEYIKALASVREDLSAMLDIENMDLLSDSFLTSSKNLDLMKQAAEGSLEAITELKEQAAKDINGELGDTELEIPITAEDGQVYNTINALISDSEQWDDLEVGVRADTDSAANALIDFYNTMIESGQMTAEQVKAALDSIGWEPDIEWVSLEASGKDIATYSGNIRVDGKDYASKEAYLESTGQAELDTSAQIFIPKINSKGTSWKGSTAKQVSSANKSAGAKNKSNSSGSKGSEKESERYFRIKRVIEEINNALSDYSKIESRAFGVDKLNAMAQQIAYYEQLQKAEQAYYDAARANRLKEQAALEAQGMKFDENGIPLNYEQWFTAHGNDDDAAKLLSKWDEDRKLEQEIEDKLTDIKNQIYDKKLNIITYKADVQIDLADFELDVLNFLKDQLDDIAYDTAEIFSNLGQQIDTNLDKYAIKRQELQDLFGLAAGGDAATGEALFNRMLAGENIYDELKELGNSEETWKKIEETWRDMADAASDAKEAWQDVLDGMIEFNEAWLDKFDKIQDRIDHQTNMISKYKDIFNLVGKNLGMRNNLGLTLDDSLIRGAQSSDKLAKERLADLYRERDEFMATEMYGDEEFEQYWEDLEDKINEAEEQAADAQISLANALKQHYDDAIEYIVDEWEAKISGAYDDLDSLSNAFDRANELHDLYLDTYDQSYKMNKLMRDINKSIDEGATLKSKQMLSSLYDEINEKQESGVKLSEYQVEAYRKEYELMLALQALEDAKNAKSTVRMQRDSEGNLGYVYTADETAIDAAQGNYDDAAYAYAQLNMNLLSDAQNQIMQLQQWFSDQMRNSAELSEQEMKEITDYYLENMDYWNEQMGAAFDHNSLLMDLTGLDYWRLADTWEDTVIATLANGQDMDDFFNDHEKLAIDMYRDLKEESAWYNDAIRENITITENVIEAKVDEANEKFSELDDKIDETSENFKEETDEMIAVTNALHSAYAATIAAVIAEAGQAGVAITNLGNQVAAQVGHWNSAATAAYNYAQALQAVAQAKALADAVGADTGSGPSKTPSTSPTTTPTTSRSTNSGHYVTVDIDGQYIDRHVVGGKVISEEIKNLDNHFASGGYTGEWGDEGRLAVLHQKELVLNADDTENFLGAVNIVRNIADYLKLQDYSANANLAMAGVGATGEFQQNVHITAEFPNATDRNEISLAFDDLLNRASQMMNRK